MISILFFGSNFNVVKEYDTKDGMFFQWCLCVGIFCTGFVLQVFLGFPEMDGMALFGGFIWATGNIFSATIINRIGVGLGVLLWGGVNIIVGWMTSRFGLFGLKSSVPTIVWLN